MKITDKINNKKIDKLWWPATFCGPRIVRSPLSPIPGSLRQSSYFIECLSAAGPLKPLKAAAVPVPSRDPKALKTDVSQVGEKHGRRCPLYPLHRPFSECHRLPPPSEDRAQPRLQQLRKPRSTEDRSNGELSSISTWDSKWGRISETPRCLREEANNGLLSQRYAY